MDSILQHDLQHIADLLKETTAQGIDFIQELPNRNTSTTHQVGAIAALPEEGLGAKAALQRFNQQFEPLMVASSGPRFWGFVTGGSTPAATMGDMLATFYDQNPQGFKGQGDISAIIENHTISLLLALFNLPKDFFGGFVTGATMSNFSCLAVARQWVGAQKGQDIAKEGLREGISILSAMPHSSAIKALAMLGMGSNNIQKVAVLAGTREAMDMEALEQQLIALNGAPCIVITSAGTVNTSDYDDMKTLALLKNKYNFWWHIDAAFGGFAACSPLYKHLLEGWENADSITIDGHKWLNVPYESAFFLVKKKHGQLQVETFQNTNAPYLGNALEDFNYLNVLPENSRRLRALPAWFTLQAYGKKGYQHIVENSVAMAQRLTAYIENSNGFDLLAPTRLNNVCFTLKGVEKQEQVSDFLFQLNASEKVFMTPTIFQGRKGIRVSFVNWRSQEQDVDEVWELMQELGG